ncbi:Intestinal-type alkaline phosphatase [Frankliniella fusca]|uniref:alkaline phosphatase n=1 Tax=Frankliniella fusca TaxID=407009 RepID=A0AAE1LLU6_9NEOP|nr:Intestinal-type alkaline phosphatase [Frankliniella fusca]
MACELDCQVLLGGGRRHFLPKVARDPEAPHEEGRRLDGRNMVDDWIRDKKKRGLHAQYVWTKAQLQAAAATAPQPAAPGAPPGSTAADNIADPQQAGGLPPGVPPPVSTSSQRPDYILGE